MIEPYCIRKFFQISDESFAALEFKFFWKILNFGIYYIFKKRKERYYVANNIHIESRRHYRRPDIYCRSV